MIRLAGVDPIIATRATGIKDKPGIIHQSSATGMQAIPTTGIAQGIQYLELIKSRLLVNGANGEAPVVVCSFGDNSLTEGEVSEAFQFAVLKQLPIVYLVQDNEWGISVSADEARAMDAYEFAAGFKGMGRMRCDGNDFKASYDTMEEAINYARKKESLFWFMQKCSLTRPSYQWRTQRILQDERRPGKTWRQ